jgi:hypothetical protein
LQAEIQQQKGEKKKCSIKDKNLNLDNNQVKKCQPIPNFNDRPAFQLDLFETNVSMESRGKKMYIEQNVSMAGAKQTTK